MNLISVGLYTFQEASRLTNATPQELRRWLNGYAHKASGSDERVKSAPLWKTELAESEVEGISFHDLLEVRFVQAFRKHGVSLQTIRIASEQARGLFNHPYPFTCKRFQTDGRTIFATALEEAGETELLDLAKRQFAFTKIIEPSLYRGIEFGNDELASHWYPLPRSKAVVLDPTIAFGKPIVTNGSVRTSTLYDAFKAEKNKQYVAKLYEVPVSSVDAAIRFEERLAA
ncbi:MAG: Uncharacterized protein AWT59_2134 [Candidatus Gallionella acididurans]|uniref:Putative antitoxin VapB45-like DNA-binding HTH domain-containing protein n=1 Tax=Candidatus Gallionella acididurans TaxID=1796491 RepID=A0A139BS53_9PROT|nr:MAG: Uncharacterized protein AWT59_2134 [Candidatus Gallionella acididurans]